MSRAFDDRVAGVRTGRRAATGPTSRGAATGRTPRRGVSGRAAWPAASRSGARRGLVLPLVLLVGLGLLLVAASAASLAGAERVGMDQVRRQAESRLVARSALAAVQAELAGARERILDGRAVELPDELVLWDEDGRLAVVRLLPVDDAGVRASSEAARLDLNTVTAERLVATGFVDEILAEAIVAERGRRGTFASVDELLDVPGVSPLRLYGEARLFGDEGGVDMAASSASGASGSGFAAIDEAPLAELLTVHAWEPELQNDGRLRIPIGTEWSDELGRRLDERFGEGTSAFVKPVFDRGDGFADRRAIVDFLVQLGADVDEWGDPLDALSYTEGVFGFGRLDLNRASEAAIASLPGVDATTAAELASVREELSDDERRTWWWPVTRELVEPEVFAGFADLVTNRSWTWRVRIEAGFVDTEAPDGPIANPVRLEAVVDLSEPRPRLAFVRDVTLLGAVAQIMEDELDLVAAAAGEEDGPAGGFGAGPGGDPAGTSPLDAEDDPFAGLGDPLADPLGDPTAGDGAFPAPASDGDPEGDASDDPFAPFDPMADEPSGDGPPVSGAGDAPDGGAGDPNRRNARWGG